MAALGGVAVLLAGAPSCALRAVLNAPSADAAPDPRDATEDVRDAFDTAPDTPPDAMPDPTLPAPRPVAPMSTSTVTSQRPTLAWELRGGATGALVTVCRDRAMTAACVQWTADGARTRPPSPFVRGTWFWQLRALSTGPRVSVAAGPVWQFATPVALDRADAGASPPDTRWGASMDVNGDGFADVVVGEPRAATNVGRVLVYLGSARGLPADAAEAIDSPRTLADLFGYVVNSAGDVNGDGYGDLAVGAPFASGRTGRAYVFHGGPDGLDPTPAAELPGTDPPPAEYGASVAGAGDIDGDGYGDVVVGGSYVNGVVGRLNVFRGSATGVSSIPSQTLLGPDRPSAFGASVASAGDVDADGYADVIVGAYGLNDGVGRAYVFRGGPAGLDLVHYTALDPPDATRSEFGGSVSGAGDVNGDGYTDVVVGALRASNYTGRMRVFRGGPTGVSSTPLTDVLGFDGPGAIFGCAVSGAGDIDADGYYDVLVAAKSVNTVYLYRGGAAGLDLGHPVTLRNPLGAAGGVFGTYVARAHDVDGDTHDDFVVTATTNGTMGTGFVHLYRGGDGIAAVGRVPLVSLREPAPQTGGFGWQAAGTR